MKKLIILFLLLFQTFSNAEVLKELKVTGNTRISSETIFVYGDIVLNKNINNEDINKILKNLYSTNFFKDVEINFINGVLNIKVEEYPTINVIQLIGEETKKVKAEILKRLKLKEKDSFIEGYLGNDINTIKSLYASLGFNFADVDAKLEEFNENRVNLIFYVNKGKKTKISKIYFIGDKKVRDRRLRDIIVSQENKFWKFITKNTNLNKRNIELDERLLTNYYKSIGYYDVQILSSNAEISKDNKTNLTFNINAGERYKITKISTSIDPVLDKKPFRDLEKTFKDTIGRYYSPFTVTKILDEVDDIVINNSLQFIEHSVNEIVSPNGIEIKINIFEGSKQLVEKINIFGNTITKESTIRGELLIDEGDPVNNLNIEKSIAKLKSRNIFGEVKEKIKDGSTKEQKIIDITVVEKPTGEISLGAGLGTNGGSVAFSISENNYMGAGVKLSSSLELNKETVRGEVSVAKPNYNYSGNELNFNISSIRNDKADSGYSNKIFQTGIGTAFEQYKDIYISPRIGFSNDSLTVQSSASDSLKKQKGTFTDLTFDYGITLDKRNRAFKPTSGYKSSFGQTLPVFADSPYIKNSYAFSAYNQFNPDVVGSVRFFTSAITGLDDKDVRISKRSTVSSKRLRGFENGKVGPKDGLDYVGGNYTTILNFEGNLPNLLPESSKADVGIFLDFGNIWGVDYDSSIDDSNKLRSSTGVNLSWLSPVGPMSFILAQNLSKASTDKEETFNFLLGTTF